MVKLNFEPKTDSQTQVCIHSQVPPTLAGKIKKITTEYSSYRKIEYRKLLGFKEMIFLPSDFRATWEMLGESESFCTLGTMVCFPPKYCFDLSAIGGSGSQGTHSYNF